MKTIKILSLLIIFSAFTFQSSLMAQGDTSKPREWQRYRQGGPMHMMQDQQPGRGPMHMMNNQQPGRERGMMIPNLTDDQKAKIKDLKTQLAKETLPLKNQLGELKAKERTLTTAATPDMKAINANIDEITTVRGKIMKATEGTNQKIRALLTDEQKLFFDTHKGQIKKKMKKQFNRE
jgi:Spy/CpxP family protein refolding chaperone